ncbi:MAG: prepilin-type N-terminal cleavage/methylation domain-containing protein [Candidatus Gracilibacteria bacterium]|nr:prepilin-type N-terminal cleavage/methylation domain-containing protein [Candidatus Gracilibacteria bacterium]MDD2908204.1 prepilin-type N-terminal cleavage/methylation domain-containing protein [Candidatus Gracilibacteria bacterium]
MKISNKQNSIPFIKGEQKGIKILKTKNYQQKINSKISLSLWERVGVRVGFTLVELIVVIVILAILSTIAFLSFNSYSSSSRDTVRVTDINSLKKSMELFSIKAGTYPTPDNGVNVTYSGGTIWTQGILGDKSTKLISTISKKPTDPLTNIPYIYSLLSNKREFQIAANFENPVSYRDNIKMNNNLFVSNFFQLPNPYIQQARASSTGTVCYINGNFNGLVAKASTGVINVILAVPSLIVVDTTNSGNLVYDDTFGEGKLQCNGASSPCNITFNSTNIVFSGSPATNGDVDIMISNLKNAYSGSSITSIPEIQNLLVASGTALTDLSSGLIKNSLGITKITPTYSCNGTLVADNAIITNNTSLTVNVGYQTTTSSNKCYYVCKPGYSGVNCEIAPIYSCIGSLVTANATITNNTSLTVDTTYQTTTSSNKCYYVCKPGYSGVNCEIAPILTYQQQGLCNIGDIIIGSYTVAGCNVGTILAGTTDISYGNWYQFGKTNNIRVNGNGAYSSDWKSPGGTNAGSANDWGIEEVEKSTATYSNQGSTDKIKMKGPCPDNYHVPTNAEWRGLIAAGDLVYWNIAGTTTEGNDFRNKLKMPFAGLLTRNIGGVFNRGSDGYYWSSSPDGINGLYIQFNQNTIWQNYNDYRFRASGFSIRCFKN